MKIAFLGARSCLATAVSGVLACAIALPAHAQSAAATSAYSGGLDEIVVTASKRSTTLIDTAASISAIGADALAAGGVKNIGDLSGLVPNLSVGNQFGVNRTFIRGIGNASIDLGSDGAVAFLQNGAQISRPAQQLSGFYDLQSVEVLRGPQGTLYGRSATAGVVNMITNKPTDKLDGYIDLTYGNYSQKTVEAALGGPLSDTFEARLATKIEKHDGYGTNLYTGNPVDDRDAQAVRLSLRFKPTENFTADLIADYFHEKDYDYAFHYFGATVSVYDPTKPAEQQIPARYFGGTTIFDHGGNIRDIWSREDAINNRHGTSVTLILDYNSGGVDFKSITSYRDLNRFNRDDLAVSNALIFGQNNYNEQSTSYTQEFTGEAKLGGVDWLGGVTYFQEDNPGSVVVPLVNLAGFIPALNGGIPGNCAPNVATAPVPCGVLNSFNYDQSGDVKTHAYGAYLQGTLDLSSHMKLTLGGRVSQEHRAGTGSFVFGPTVNVPTDENHTWGAFTPKALLEYRTDGGTLLYGSINRGFKPGVINIGSVNPVLGPEYVWAYEVGAKGKALDNKLEFSTAAFYYDYHDLQLGFVNAASVVSTVNAKGARNYGLEVELAAHATDALTIKAAGTLLSAKYTDFTSLDYRNGFKPTSVDGNYLDNAPTNTLRVGADYVVRDVIGGRLTLHADSTYQSTVYFTEFNNADASQSGYTLYNGFVRWDAASHWSATGWIRNAGNKLVETNNIITAPLYSSVRVGTLAPPRTFGLTVGYKF